MAGCRLNVLAGSDKKQQEKKKVIQEQVDFDKISMNRGQGFEPKESYLIPVGYSSMALKHPSMECWH